MINELNEQNFESETNSQEYVLVDFFATWCGPCKMMGPVLADLDKDNLIKICKCDVDKNNSIALRYQVQSIPTLILFKKGEPIATLNGYTPKEKLAEFINSNKK